MFPTQQGTSKTPPGVSRPDKFDKNQSDEELYNSYVKDKKNQWKRRTRKTVRFVKDQVKKFTDSKSDERKKEETLKKIIAIDNKPATKYEGPRLFGTSSLFVNDDPYIFHDDNNKGADSREFLADFQNDDSFENYDPNVVEHSNDNEVETGENRRDDGSSGPFSASVSNVDDERKEEEEEGDDDIDSLENFDLNDEERNDDKEVETGENRRDDGTPDPVSASVSNVDDEEKENKGDDDLDNEKQRDDKKAKTSENRSEETPVKKGDETEIPSGISNGTVYLAQSSFVDKYFDGEKRLSTFNKDMFLNVSPVGDTIHIRLPESSSSSSVIDLQKILSDINKDAGMKERDSRVVALRLDFDRENDGVEVIIPPRIADEIVTLLGRLEVKLFTLLSGRNVLPFSNDGKIRKLGGDEGRIGHRCRKKRKNLIGIKIEIEKLKAELARTLVLHANSFHLEMIVVTVLLINYVQTFLDLINFCLGDTPRERNILEAEVFKNYVSESEDDNTMNQTVIEFLFKVVLTYVCQKLSKNEGNEIAIVSPAVISFLKNGNDDGGECAKTLLNAEIEIFLKAAETIALPLINVKPSERGFEAYASEKETGRLFTSREDLVTHLDNCFGPLSDALILKSWTKSDFRKQKRMNGNIRKLVFYIANSKMAQKTFKNLLPKIIKFDTSLRQFTRTSDRIESFSSSFSHDGANNEADIMSSFEMAFGSCDNDDYSFGSSSDDDDDDDSDDAGNGIGEEMGERRRRRRSRKDDDAVFFKELQNYNRTLDRVKSSKFRNQTVYLEKGNIIDFFCRDISNNILSGCVVSSGPDRFIFADVETAIMGAQLKNALAQSRNLSAEKARSEFISPLMFDRVHDPRTKKVLKKYMLSLVTLMRHGGRTLRYVLREWLLRDQSVVSKELYDVLMDDYEFINSNFADPNLINFTENLYDATQNLKSQKVNKILKTISKKIEALANKDDEDPTSSSSSSSLTSVVDPQISAFDFIELSESLIKFFTLLESALEKPTAQLKVSAKMDQEAINDIKKSFAGLEPYAISWIRKIKKNTGDKFEKINIPKFLKIYSEIIACVIAYSMNPNGQNTPHETTMKKMKSVELIVDGIIKALGDITAKIRQTNKVILTLPLSAMTLKNHSCLTERAFRDVVTDLRGFISLPPRAIRKTDDDDDEALGNKGGVVTSNNIPGCRESDYAKNELDRLNVLKNRDVKMTMGSILKPLTKMNYRSGKIYYGLKENRHVEEGEGPVDDEGVIGGGGGDDPPSSSNSVVINGDDKIADAAKRFLQNPGAFVAFYQGDKSVSSLIGGIHQGKWVANTIDNYAYNFISPVVDIDLRNIDAGKITNAMGWGEDDNRQNQRRRGTSSSTSPSSKMITVIASKLDTVIKDAIHKMRVVITNASQVSNLLLNFNDDVNVKSKAKILLKKLKIINKTYYEHLDWSSNYGDGRGPEISSSGGSGDPPLYFPFIDDSIGKRKRHRHSPFDHLGIRTRDYFGDQSDDEYEVVDNDDDDDGDEDYGDEDRLRSGSPLNRKRRSRFEIDRNCVLKSESRAVLPGSVKASINSIDPNDLLEYLKFADEVLNKIALNLQKLQRHRINNYSDHERLYEKISQVLNFGPEKNDLFENAPFYNSRYFFVIREFLKKDRENQPSQRISPELTTPLYKLMAIMGGDPYNREYVTPQICDIVGEEKIIETLLTNYVQGGGEVLFSHLIEEIIKSGARFNSEDIEALKKIRKCAGSVDAQLKKLKASERGLGGDGKKKKKKGPDQLVSEQVLVFLERKKHFSSREGGSDCALFDEYYYSSDDSGSISMRSETESELGNSDSSSSSSGSSSDDEDNFSSGDESSSSSSSSSGSESDEGVDGDEREDEKDNFVQRKKRRTKKNVLISDEFVVGFARFGLRDIKEKLSRLKKTIETNQNNYEKLLKVLRDSIHTTDGRENATDWENVFRIICFSDEIDKTISQLTPIIRDAYKNANMLWNDYLPSFTDKTTKMIRGEERKSTVVSSWWRFLHGGSGSDGEETRGGADISGDEKLKYLDLLTIEASSLVKDFDRGLGKRLNNYVKSMKHLDKSLQYLENGLVDRKVKNLKKVSNLKNLEKKRLNFVSRLINLHDPMVFVNTKMNTESIVPSLILAKTLNFNLNGLGRHANIDEKLDAVSKLRLGGGGGLKSMEHNPVSDIASSMINFNKNGSNRKYSDNPLLDQTLSSFKRIYDVDSHGRPFEEPEIPLYGVIDVSSEKNSLDSVIFRDVFKKPPKHFVKYVSRLCGDGDEERKRLILKYFRTESPLGPFLMGKGRPRLPTSNAAATSATAADGATPSTSRSDDPLSTAMTEVDDYGEYYNYVSRRRSDPENFLLTSAYCNMFGKIPFIILVANSKGEPVFKDFKIMSKDIKDLKKIYFDDSNSCLELLDTLEATPTQELEYASSSYDFTKISKSFSKITSEFKRSFLYLQHLKSMGESVGALCYDCNSILAFMREGDFAREYFHKLLLKYKYCVKDLKNEQDEDAKIGKIFTNLSESLDKMTVNYSTLLKDIAEAISIIEKSVDRKRSKLEKFINRPENKPFLENYVSWKTVLKVSETGLDGSYFPLFANRAVALYRGMTEDAKNILVHKFRENLLTAYRKKGDDNNNYNNAGRIYDTKSLMMNRTNDAYSSSVFPENFNSFPSNRKSYLVSNIVGTPRDNRLGGGSINDDNINEYDICGFNRGGMCNPLNLRTVEFELSSKLIERFSNLSFLTFNARLILDQFIDNSLSIQFQKQNTGGDASFSSRSRGLNFDSPYTPGLEDSSAESYGNPRDVNSYYYAPHVVKDFATIKNLFKFVEHAESALEGLKHLETESILSDTNYLDAGRSEIQSSVANFDRELGKLSAYSVSSTVPGDNYPIVSLQEAISKYLQIFTRFSELIDEIEERIKLIFERRNEDKRKTIEEGWEENKSKVEEDLLSEDKKLRDRQLELISAQNEIESKILVLKSAISASERSIERLKKEIQEDSTTTSTQLISPSSEEEATKRLIEKENSLKLELRNLTENVGRSNEYSVKSSEIKKELEFIKDAFKDIEAVRDIKIEECNENFEKTKADVTERDKNEFEYYSTLIRKKHLTIDENIEKIAKQILFYESDAMREGSGTGIGASSGVVGAVQKHTNSSFQYRCFSEDLHELLRDKDNNFKTNVPSKIVPLICEYCVKLLFGLHTEVAKESHNFNFEGVEKLNRISNITRSIVNNSNITDGHHALMEELLFNGPNAHLSNLSFQTEKTVIAYTPYDSNFASAANARRFSSPVVATRTILLPTSELLACRGHDFVKFRASLTKSLDPMLYKNITKSNTLSSNIALLPPNEEYLFFARKDEKESFASVRNCVLESCRVGDNFANAADSAMCDKYGEFEGPGSLNDLVISRRRTRDTKNDKNVFPSGSSYATYDREGDNNNTFVENKRERVFQEVSRDSRHLVQSAAGSRGNYFNLDFGTSLICAEGSNFDSVCNEKFVKYQLNDMSKRLFREQYNSIEESALNIGKRLATSIDSLTGGAYKSNPITIGKIQSLTMSDLGKRFNTNYGFLMDSKRKGSKKSGPFSGDPNNFYYSFLDIMGTDRKSDSVVAEKLEQLRGHRDIHLLVPNNALRTSAFNSFYNHFNLNDFRNVYIDKERGCDGESGNVFSNIFNLNIEDFLKKNNDGVDASPFVFGRDSNPFSSNSLLNKIKYIPFPRIAPLQKRQNEIVRRRMIDSVNGRSDAGAHANNLSSLPLKHLMGTFVNTIMATSSPLIYRGGDGGLDEEKISVRRGRRCPRCSAETNGFAATACYHYLHDLIAEKGGDSSSSSYRDVGGIGSLSPQPSLIFNDLIADNACKMKNYLREISRKYSSNNESGQFSSTILDKLVDYFDKNNKIASSFSTHDEDRCEAARYNVASVLHRTNVFSKTLKSVMQKHMLQSHERNFTDFIRNAYLRKGGSRSAAVSGDDLANDYVLPTLSEVPFMGQYLLLERFQELVMGRVDPSIIAKIKNQMNFGHMQNIFNPENKMLSLLYVVMARDSLSEIARDRVLSSVYLTKSLKRMDRAPTYTDIPSLVCDYVLLSTALKNTNRKKQRNTYFTDTFLACSTDKTSLLNNIRRYEDLFHRENDIDQMLRLPKCLCPMKDHHWFQPEVKISSFFSCNRIVDSEELLASPYLSQKVLAKADYVRNISSLHVDVSRPVIEKTIPVLMNCGNGESYSNSLHSNREALDNLLINPAGVNLSCVVSPRNEDSFRILKSRRCFRSGFCASDYKATVASRLNASRLPAPSDSIEPSTYIQRGCLNPKLISVINSLHNDLISVQERLIGGLHDRLRELKIDDLVSDSVMKSLTSLNEELKDIIVRNSVIANGPQSPHSLGSSSLVEHRRFGGAGGGGVRDSSLSITDFKNVLCHVAKLKHGGGDVVFSSDRKNYYNEPTQLGSGIPNLEFLAKRRNGTTEKWETNKNFSNRINQLVDEDDIDLVGNIENLSSLLREGSGGAGAEGGEKKEGDPPSLHGGDSNIIQLIYYIFKKVKKNLKPEDYAKIAKKFSIPVTSNVDDDEEMRMDVDDDDDEEEEEYRRDKLSFGIGKKNEMARDSIRKLKKMAKFMPVGETDKIKRNAEEENELKFFNQMYTFLSIFRTEIKPYFNSQKENIKKVFRIVSALIHVNNLLKYGLSNSSSYDLSHLGANSDIPIDESVVFQTVEPIIAFAYCKISALLYVKEIESRNDIVTHRQTAVSFFNHPDTVDIKRNGEFLIGKGGSGPLGVNLATLVQSQSYLYSLNLDSVSSSCVDCGNAFGGGVDTRFCRCARNTMRRIPRSPRKKDSAATTIAPAVEDNYSPFLTVPGHRKLQVSMPTDFSGLVVNTDVGDWSISSLSGDRSESDSAVVYLHTDAIIPLTTQLSMTDCYLTGMGGRCRLVPEIFKSLQLLSGNGEGNSSNAAVGKRGFDEIISFDPDKFDIEFKDLKKLVDAKSDNENYDFWRYIRAASPSSNFLNAYFLKNKNDNINDSGAVSGDDMNTQTALKKAGPLLADLQNNTQRATKAIIKSNLAYSAEMNKLYHTTKEVENLRKHHEQLMHDNNIALACIKNVEKNLSQMKPLLDGFSKWKKDFSGSRGTNAVAARDPNVVYDFPSLLLSSVGDSGGTSASSRNRYNSVGGLTSNFNKIIRNFQDMYEESLEKISTDDGGVAAAERSKNSLSELYKKYHYKSSFRNNFIDRVCKHYRDTHGIVIQPESMKMTISNKQIFSVMATIIGIDDKNVSTRCPRYVDEEIDDDFPSKRIVRDSDALEEEIKLNSVLFH